MTRAAALPAVSGPTHSARWPACAAWRLGAAAALAGVLAGAAPAAWAQGAAAPAGTPPADYGARYAAECAACHGANGRDGLPDTPVLAGQHAFYAITQLFLFREGRRANPAMSAVAKGMKDADLRGFSEAIAKLPPVPAPAPAEPADAPRLARGEALARQHRCLMCHGDDLSGGQQVPRIGGQREAYLRMTLREFRDGSRPGYSMAMGEAVSGIAPEDLDTIAYFVARMPVAGTSR